MLESKRGDGRKEGQEMGGLMYVLKGEFSMLRNEMRRFFIFRVALRAGLTVSLACLH